MSRVSAVFMTGVLVDTVKKDKYIKLDYLALQWILHDQYLLEVAASCRLPTKSLAFSKHVRFITDRI